MKKNITFALGCLIFFIAACCFILKPITKDTDASSSFRTDKPSQVIILTPGTPLSSDLNGDISREIFSQINSYRAASGLKALTWSDELADAATIRAEEAGILWSHNRPNGTEYYTVNPAIVYGENLAKGYDTADEVVEAWKNSPAHNENLLYPDYKYIAIAKVGSCYSAEFCY